MRRRLSTQADQLARITFPAPPELLALKPPQGEIQQAPPVYRQGSGMARPGSNINIVSGGHVHGGACSCHLAALTGWPSACSTLRQQHAH